jgi:hypothetical protein
MLVDKEKNVTTQIKPVFIRIQNCAKAIVKTTVQNADCDH